MAFVLTSSGLQQLQVGGHQPGLANPLTDWFSIFKLPLSSA